LGAGILANPTPGPWSGEDGLSIAWLITPFAGGYTYEYTIEVPEHALSHVIFGLSESCNSATTSTTKDDNCIWSLSSANLGPDEIRLYSPSDPGQSNPLLPGDIFGIKVDTTGDPLTLNLSFNSDRIPVWQNFYAKDGKTGGQGGGDDIVAWNAGFGSAISPNFYIAAPDTVIPEPGFYGLITGGLAGLYFLKRRKRNA
jgi:hypothetical protein